MNDRLEQIEARIEAVRGITINGHSLPSYATKDREYLLGLVREQQARLERVKALHAQRFYDEWARDSEMPIGYGGWCNTCGRFDGDSCPTIAALTAPEGS